MQKIRCQSCGHEFAADVTAEQLAELTCEACGSAVLEVIQPDVTEGEAAAPETEEQGGAAAGEEAVSEDEVSMEGGPSGVPLALREDEEYIEVPARACPNCGAAIPQDAVLCVNCGYDLRTGRLLAVRKTGPVLPALVGLVIGLVIGGLAGYLAGQSGQPAAPAAPSAQARVETEPGAGAPVAAPAPVLPASGAAESAQPPVVGAPAVEEAKVATEGEPALPSQLTDTERAGLRQRIEQRLSAWMEKRYPPYEKDKEADLRLRSGIVYRGRYLGVKGDTAVIVKGGESLELPLAELDVASRLRADMAYRSQYLERAVARYEQRLLGEKQPAQQKQ